MNLFVTSMDPTECAQALDDKRVGKLLMEANQMLSLAVKLNHFSDSSLVALNTGPGMLTQGYAHENHPVSIWVRMNAANFDWTLDHAHALASEFRLRFGKQHESAIRTDFIEQFRGCLEAGPLLPFQNSARNAGTGVDFTYLPVPYSYRHYLLARWRTDTRPVTFTKRQPPAWSHLK